MAVLKLASGVVFKRESADGCVVVTIDITIQRKGAESTCWNCRSNY